MYILKKLDFAPRGFYESFQILEGVIIIKIQRNLVTDFLKVLYVRVLPNDTFSVLKKKDL